mmetsp:Transcript_19934/g.40374  ORF Transcript_19934/g.40374 Transcript_19934/m.40374 type:complete len:287 (-) Transcript_19934:67-927(-)
MATDRPIDSPGLASSDRCTVFFIVTGFGPFRGVSDNPTTTITKNLKAYLSRTNKKGSEKTDVDSADEKTPPNAGPSHKRPSKNRVIGYEDWEEISSNTSTSVFETSAACVKSGMDDIMCEVAKAQKGHSFVFLHLGVNYKGKQFQIERCAYNDASFRIADEAGYQPKKECVIDDSGREQKVPFGQKYTTTLNVNRLCRDMAEKCGFQDSVMVSGDAGRFVCNYVYCYSLDKASIFNSSHTSPNEKEVAPVIHSIFLHVPPLEVEGIERQMEFVKHLMGSIWLQLAN